MRTLVPCPNGGKCGSKRHYAGSQAFNECGKLAALGGAAGSNASSLAAPPPSSRQRKKTPNRRAKTSQAKREKYQKRAEELQENIAKEVELLKDSEEWQRMLDFRKNMSYPYSLNNFFLIKSQRKTATAVAGFKKWQENGRQVRKGERSIKIFGFAKKKVGEEINEETGKKEPVYRPYFPILSVFDIEQTDSIDPEKDIVKDIEAVSATPIKGADEQQIIGKMTSVANKLGYRVEFADLSFFGTAQGYADTEGKKIVISDQNDPAMQAKTLIHEVAHAVLHEDVNYHERRGLYETEAESTAYVVAGLMGADTTDYSVSYVAGWSGLEADTLRKSAENVLKGTDKIMSLLEEEEE